MATVVSSALDLLESGESALVLFTRGPRLSINPDASGSSGNWVLDCARQVDHVIIYNKRPYGDTSRVDVYLAEHTGTAESSESGRYVVHFQNVRLVGEAGGNWHEFAETGANPVRFISKD